MYKLIRRDEKKKPYITLLKMATDILRISLPDFIICIIE